MMTARPQTVGYGATDSPAGLAAWILVHPGFAQWTYGADPGKSPTKDDVLDNITLYWLTNTATSSARLYWENGARGSVIVAAAQKTTEISLPVAITVFPEDVYRAPETWARRAYRNLIYFHEVDKGGHFAAWEQPELFSAELRAAFRSLRWIVRCAMLDRGLVDEDKQAVGSCDTRHCDRGADCGLCGGLDMPESTTSPGVRVPLLHGLPTARIPQQPELASLERASEWLNSPPLTAPALRGKVVLIDFWTYTCINWLRTLPYVRAWAEKYRDKGLGRDRRPHAGVPIRKEHRKRTPSG